MPKSDTLVIQSHRSPLPYAWLQNCLDSVRQWAGMNHYEYIFLGDELFDPVDHKLLDKTRQQKVIATDLARLFQLQKGLAEGYSAVIWCDADFLIFNPEQFVLPAEAYALGREVWIQADKNNRLKTYRKVHTAFLMFRQDNNFLDFYTETAERLLTMISRSMPPQFIGPKLLTALHNIVHCPVLETAGMLSPLVIRDIAQGQGPALDLFLQDSEMDISAANISASTAEQEGLSGEIIRQAIQRMLESKRIGQTFQPH